jgi:T-complex protein 1 subunit gamma
MLLDSMGTLVITNDGNSILREIDIAHPAAKAVVEISRGQDEEVGDGTKSVVVLPGELLSVLEPLLQMQIHPHVIIAGLRKALDDALIHLRTLSTPLDPTNDNVLRQIISAAIRTKFLAKWSDFIAALALDAVKLVRTPEGVVDLKRQVRIERIPGGEIEDSYVMKGVMIEKDVLHSAMRRRIEHPKVLLLDCGLEYRKGESITNIEITGEDDYALVLQEEETQVRELCAAIIATGCDIVCAEKGVSDLAQHFLSEAGVTALRRFQKVQLERIAAATGATILTDPRDARPQDLGHKCGLYECRKFQDEWWSFFDQCEDPKACTMLLRGPTKDILGEMFRILDDALKVGRNLLNVPALVPGGGAAEASVSVFLRKKAGELASVEQMAYGAAAVAFEVIPRTLIQNCGEAPMRVLTRLRAIHAGDPGKYAFGVNGFTGAIEDMREVGIWDTLAVKAQVYKTAFECAISLLRVDEIVSGLVKRDEAGNPVSQKSVTQKLEENTAAARGE